MAKCEKGYAHGCSDCVGSDYCTISSEDALNQSGVISLEAGDDSNRIGTLGLSARARGGAIERTNDPSLIRI